MALNAQFISNRNVGILDSAHERKRPAAPSSENLHSHDAMDDFLFPLGGADDSLMNDPQLTGEFCLSVNEESSEARFCCYYIV